MITPDEMRLLYDYNSWANHRVLESCGALSGAQFTRDLGSSFGSVRDTLAHILGAEWLWLERFHGRSPAALLAAGDFPTLESIRMRWAVLERDLDRFVGALTAEGLARVYSFQTLTSGTLASPLWQAMQHLVNHGTYHRGQVATMLRQLGVKPTATDLIRFYRERAAGAA